MAKRYPRNGVDLFNNSHFPGIRNLQLVATAADCDLESILRRAQSPHLVWLRCTGCFYSSLPNWIPMDNLKVLEVQGSKLKFLWPHESQGPLRLRELNICAPISQIPKSIGQLEHLERIVISGLSGFPPTVEFLPEDFGHLRSLKYLELNGFPKLMSLPESFGKLTNLRDIYLKGVSNLQMLPNSFGDLSRLEHLSLNGTTSIKLLPDSFGKLTNLQRINLGDASSLQLLPNSFGDLSRLEHLSVNLATAIKLLPDSLGKLTNLRHIKLTGASSLQMLPNSFGDLSRLEHLSLSHASSIKLLPDSFGKLTNLPHIDLRYASSLLMLPKSFGDLSRLKHLSLRQCSSLTISSGALGNITTLEYLDLQCCSNLKESAPQIAHQRSLKKLFMPNTELKELQCFISDLCNLEVLHICLPPSVRYSAKLACLPDSFEPFTQLRDLKLEGCGIEYLPQGLLNLNNLRELQVVDCPLREFPFRPDERETEGGRACNPLAECMPRLERLVLRRTKISEVAFPKGVCPNLQYLGIESCQELRRIRGLCHLSKLRFLSIESCVKVEDLESLENLRSLWLVRVRGCRRLKSIQGLAQLTQLGVLDVHGCHDLVGLPGVEQCMRLWRLNTRYCPKLQWGGGVLQQLRHRLPKGNMDIDVIAYKRRKLRGD